MARRSGWNTPRRSCSCAKSREAPGLKIAAVIPARLGSTRFPGKPLAPILGRPMIEHIYRRTGMCRSLAEVLIATCDDEVAAVARGFGAEAVMTSAAHERATDRVAEAADTRRDVDIWVLVQGDEPMVVPEMIDLALGPMRSEPDVVCVNLGASIRSVEEFEDPNCVKVVVGRDGDALYFSREPIPTRRRLAFSALEPLKQVCIIPFRSEFLRTYSRLEPTPLERAESIDMLRALEHGYPIRIVRSPYQTQSVDTPGDLRLVESLMQRDPLVRRYGGVGAARG